MSPLDSSCYVEYIRTNRLNCDILGVSSKQLLAISIQYLCAEAELEKAEEHVARLPKQKKIWREKLTRAISRDIFDIKELEKMKTEKAVRVEGVSRSLAEGLSVAMYKLIDITGRHHTNL